MRRLFLLIGAWFAAVAPAGASAADVFETLRIPTAGGESIHVEIARPAGALDVPIVLTYSPYNTLSEGTTPNLANDALFERFGPQGYARAVADVLGTRNSTGCWDYGGRAEQQSGVDLVNALARLPWANGRVAMIGGSYDGTTATMVAARGADAPGLAAIVPQAAISRWYGYAYQDGVRYFLNSDTPTDEGFDTPLAFDFGLSRTPPTSASGLAALEDRARPCAAVEHTLHGYDATPDYDTFWDERDYRAAAGRIRVPALVTHGWQDYNVKQSEGVDLYAALPGRRKKLFVYQGTHGAPASDAYAALLGRFFDATLKGAANGLWDEPPVWTEGRTATATVPLRTERAWPPPGTAGLDLPIGAGSFVASAVSEEAALRAPDGAGAGAWLWSQSAPATADVRLAGSAYADVVVRSSTPHGQLAATLVDVAPDGTRTAIARGHLNLQYRDGLRAARPVPVGTPVRAVVRLAPQDHTVERGHAIGLVLAGANVVWAVPDRPGTTIDVERGTLRLPVVGPEPAPPAGAAPPIPGATVATSLVPGGRPAPAGRLTLRLRRRGTTVVATGAAPRGARVALRLVRRGRREVRRTVTARAGTFRVTFRRIARRPALRVAAASGALRATRRLAGAGGRARTVVRG